MSKDSEIIEKRGFTNKREVLILTSFSIGMWSVLYFPIGIMEGFNLHQWEVWFFVTTWYDIPMEFIGAKLIISFNSRAKERNWY